MRLLYPILIRGFENLEVEMACKCCVYGSHSSHVHAHYSRMSARYNAASAYLRYRRDRECTS